VVSIASHGRLIFRNDRLRLLELSAGAFPVLMFLSKEQNIMQEALVLNYHLNKGTIRSIKKTRKCRPCNPPGGPPLSH
jgi:hypothetical protein